MNFKKNIQKLIVHLLKFIINEKCYMYYELLNNYLKFNIKSLKFSEVKIYLNNNYIIKIGFESYYIYKDLIDVNYQVIKDINKIDFKNYIIEDYYHNIYGNDAIIIKLYSHLYLKNNIKKEDVLPLIKKEDVLPLDNEIIYNEKSTILNDDDLDVLNWINN